MEGIETVKILNDIDLYEIVTFNILQIGEIVKNLPNEFKLKYQNIPWKLIAGMRDRIAHGYETISKEFVVNIVEFDIGELDAFCDSIINEQDLQSKDVETVDNLGNK